MVGYGVNELTLDKDFQLKIIGVKQADTMVNCVGFAVTELNVVNEQPDNYKLQKGDILVCYGKYKDFQRFWKAL